MATIMIRNTTIRSIAFAAGIALLAFAAPAPRVLAATWYWNTNTTGLWTTTSNWSDNPSTGGSSPSTAPTTGDTAYFNQSTKSGATTLRLSADQSIDRLVFANTGATTITGTTANRILTIGTVGITINSGAGAVTLGNATSGSQVAIAIGGSQTWANNSSNTFTVTNGITSTSGTQTLTIGGSGPTAVSGTIGNGTAGNRVSLTKSGAGNLTLSGNNNYGGLTTLTAGVLALSGSNSGAGGVTQNGGTLIVGNKNALGTGQLTAAGTLLQASTDLSGANAIANNVLWNSAVQTISGSNNITFSGTWTNQGTTGRTLTSSLDAGKTLVIAGPVNLTNAATAYGAFVINGTGNTTISGNITPGSGTGTPLVGLQIRNTATTRLSGNNNYGGQTRIEGGVLLADSANALSPNSNVILSGGGILGLGTGNSTFTRSLGTAAGQVRWTWTGGVSGSSGGFAAYGSDATVNLGGNVTPDTLTWNTTSGFLANGWTFILGAANATHTVDFRNPIALANAVRTVQVNDGSAAVDARLSGVLSSVSAGNGLTKTGLGTLELSAANTYSGTTAINAGRFLVSSAGNLSNTARVVVNGSGADFRWNSSTAFTRPLTMTQGTISGTGTISASGGVSIGTNAILSPGNSPGIQAYTTSLAWAPGGTYQWELNSLTGTAGTNWDLVNATSGTFSLAGLSSVPGNQFVLDLITLAAGDVAGQLVNPYDGGSYTFAIASYNPANFLLPGGFSNTAGADLTSLFTINLGNWQGAQPEAGNIAVKINSTATGLDLVIVPEPGAIALAGIGIAAAAYALRRRRR